MDFIIGSIQSGCCYQLVDFLHILHINGNMVNGAGFHFCCFVLVRLDHKISKLQESNLLVGSLIYCLKSDLKAQCFIKFNGCLNVIGRHTYVLNSVHLIF